MGEGGGGGRWGREVGENGNEGGKVKERNSWEKGKNGGKLEEGEGVKGERE